MTERPIDIHALQGEFLRLFPAQTSVRAIELWSQFRHEDGPKPLKLVLGIADLLEAVPYQNFPAAIQMARSPEPTKEQAGSAFLMAYTILNSYSATQNFARTNPDLKIPEPIMVRTLVTAASEYQADIIQAGRDLSNLEENRNDTESHELLKQLKSRHALATYLRLYQYMIESNLSTQELLSTIAESQAKYKLANGRLPIGVGSYTRESGPSFFSWLNSDEREAVELEVQKYLPSYLADIFIQTHIRGLSLAEAGVILELDESEADLKQMAQGADLMAYQLMLSQPVDSLPIGELRSFLLYKMGEPHTPLDPVNLFNVRAELATQMQDQIDSEQLEMLMLKAAGIPNDEIAQRYYVRRYALIDILEHTEYKLRVFVSQNYPKYLPHMQQILGKKDYRTEIVAPQED